MEARNLIVFLKTHTIKSLLKVDQSCCFTYCFDKVIAYFLLQTFVKKLFQCYICDFCCFQVDIKVHEKQTWRRKTPQFFFKHTLAVHFVKKLFQCDICDYYCFQVVIKTHEKQKCRRKVSQFFSEHTIAVHFGKNLFQYDFCDYC